MRGSFICDYEFSITAAIKMGTGGQDAVNFNLILSSV